MAEKKEAAKKTVKPETANEKEEVQANKTETTEEKEESYLKDLMAISGHGGLFKFVSQGRSGIIVEHLETGKRMQAFASMKVSALEDIAVYAKEEEIKLEVVFTAIHKYENGKEAISPKSDSDDLKDYFGAILPEYNRERVYVSDIKKILGWYNMLLKYDLIETGKPARKSPAKETEAEDKKAKPKPAAGKAPAK